MQQLDFAGGLVVHATCGVAALASVLVIGPRKGFGHSNFLPHNLPMTMLGTGLLWFGWFGFNGGSALAANEVAATAFVATHLGGMAGMAMWTAMEWVKLGKPTTLGAASGAIAGLAERDGRAIGYAVAGPAGLPHPDVAQGDGELKRLYVRAGEQNGGLGSRLFAQAMAWLERDGPRTLWIGVWSENHGAQRFYARHGFARVGRYEFPVGRVRDLEFILRRPAAR